MGLIEQEKKIIKKMNENMKDVIDQNRKDFTDFMKKKTSISKEEKDEKSDLLPKRKFESTDFF